MQKQKKNFVRRRKDFYLFGASRQKVLFGELKITLSCI